MRTLIAIMALICAASAVHAFGLGEGNRFGKLGAIGGGNKNPAIEISNTTIASTATIGSLVGVLTVINGTGTYTFTLTSNPGTLFAISGSNLNVAAALTAGSDPITIQANNGAGSVITQPFTITVTSPGTNGPMDFSVAGNIAITAALP